MTPPLLFAVLFFAVGISAPADAEPSSPLQSGQTGPGPWANPHLLLVLNQDQFAGNWKQFKGDLKQRWGAFTDDDLLYIEGSLDKYEGKLQERYGDRKEEVKQWADEWFKKNREHDKESSAHEAR